VFMARDARWGAAPSLDDPRQKTAPQKQNSGYIFSMPFQVRFCP